MINFANKTDLILAQGLAVDMGTESAKTGTPENLKRRLGDLSRLAILNCSAFVYGIGGSTGSATIEVLAGGSVLSSVVFSAAAGSELAEKFVVDLTGVAGHSEIELVVTCETTGDPLTVSAWLEIEHPIVIGA